MPDRTPSGYFYVSFHQQSGVSWERFTVEEGVNEPGQGKPCPYSKGMRLFIVGRTFMDLSFDMGMLIYLERKQTV
jgi:hypothetical protein